jgi:hypothetical protein
MAMAHGEWRRDNAYKLVEAVYRDSGIRLDIIGSVERKGRSEHDLDLLVPGLQDFKGRNPNESITKSLGNNGFQYIGQHVFSPKDAKTMKRGKIRPPEGMWSEIHIFRNNETGQKIEIWSVLK